MSSRIFLIILTLAIFVLGGCANSNRENNKSLNDQTEIITTTDEMTKEDLEVINYPKDYFTDYLVAEIKTEIITSSTSYISVKLVDQDDEVNIKSCEDAFELNILINNTWYNVPLVDNSQYLETSIWFNGESIKNLLLFLKSFEINPGHYRIIFNYLIDGESKWYHTFTEFDVED